MYTIVDPVAGVRGEACSSLPGDPPEVMLASELAGRRGGMRTYRLIELALAPAFVALALWPLPGLRRAHREGGDVRRDLSAASGVAVAVLLYLASVYLWSRSHAPLYGGALIVIYVLLQRRTTLPVSIATLAALDLATPAAFVYARQHAIVWGGRVVSCNVPATLASLGVSSLFLCASVAFVVAPPLIGWLLTVGSLMASGVLIAWFWAEAGRPVLVPEIAGWLIVDATTVVLLVVVALGLKHWRRSRSGRAGLAALLSIAAALPIYEIGRVLREPSFPREERSAPAFSVPTANGRRLELADFKGRIAIVSFWASWCGPCRRELPELAQFTASWNRDPAREVDLVCLAIDVGEAPERVKDFISDPRLETVQFGFDRDRSVSWRWNVHGLPTTVVILPGGSVLDSTSGFGPFFISSLEQKLKAYRRHAAAGSIGGTSSVRRPCVGSREHPA